MGVYRNLRVQGPPGEEALRITASQREADLLRSAFGDVDMVGPEEELIRDLADINPVGPDEDDDAEEADDEEGGVDDDAAI
jgi:hypothetical protein